jgi:hypothetical protein
MTTCPPITIKAAMPTRARGAIQINRFLIMTPQPVRNSS